MNRTVEGTMTPTSLTGEPPARGAAGVGSSRCGIGLRAPHARALAETRAEVGFLEVHAENYFAEGGAARAALLALRRDYPVSLHGVGMSLGSACGLDLGHLARFARLCEEIDPVLVSEHAAFGRAPRGPGGAVVHGSDLLPLAFTWASLEIVVAHVQQVQEALRRPILVENLSAYLCWSEADMDEPDFLRLLTQRSGCGLLLDVNNLVVNERNRRPGPDDEPPAEATVRFRALEWMDRLPPGSVGEIHLAGHRDLGDIVIDDHGSRVSEVVWSVYEAAIGRFGAVPSLIEWDTDLPDLGVLLAEAAQADQRAAQALRQAVSPC